jgi:hypothetical protein
MAEVKFVSLTSRQAYGVPLLVDSPESIAREERISSALLCVLL